MIYYDLSVYPERSVPSTAVVVTIDYLLQYVDDLCFYL